MISHRKNARRIAKFVIAAAASAAVFDVGHVYGDSADVTAITTHNTVGTTTTVSGVSGYGVGSGVYKTSDSYTLKYLGDDDAITLVNAGVLGTYNASGQGTTVVRRGANGGNNDNIWYAGTGSATNASTVTLDSSPVSNVNQAFSTNNVLTGADNIFSNMGNAAGNNTNVERIDILIPAGMSASAQTAFAIFDRGPSNDHDTFQIAAITSLTNGLPSGYGTLESYSDGTWGKTVIVPPGTTQENILRKDNTVPGDSFHPSDETSQAVGGILIQTDTLVGDGTPIYGYSLFSAAAGGSESTLVNWTDLPPADSTSSGGGLDPLATLGVVYTSTSGVPEPASAGILMLGIGAFVSSRNRRFGGGSLPAEAGSPVF